MDTHNYLGPTDRVIVQEDDTGNENQYQNMNSLCQPLMQ
jgi:hypothetical protein